MDSLPPEIILEIMEYLDVSTRRKLFRVSKSFYNITPSFSSYYNAILFQKPILSGLAFSVDTESHQANPHLSTLFYYQPSGGNVGMYAALNPEEYERTRKIINGDQDFEDNKLVNFNFKDESAFSPPLERAIVQFRIEGRDWWKITHPILQMFAFKLVAPNREGITVGDLADAVLERLGAPGGPGSINFKSIITEFYPRGQGRHCYGYNKHWARRGLSRILRSYCWKEVRHIGYVDGIPHVVVEFGWGR